MQAKRDPKFGISVCCPHPHTRRIRLQVRRRLQIHTAGCRSAPPAKAAGCRFLHGGRRCLPAGGCHLRPFHAPRQSRRPPLSQAGPRPSPKPPATTASSWSTPLAKAAGRRCLHASCRCSNPALLSPRCWQLHPLGTARKGRYDPLFLFYQLNWCGTV
jgi:hypothetical protein